ncbi:hypothetical protein K3N28_09415 [Glycomyces sp. TRM65418]|uniref:hypothetical protein n=1 Tax=Glycomyces sp. TRM65418 TaxID=2867006 RepID=UPI001CE6E6E3|nr:hypothetical protein [Glycomyces sp. TRM65418]MCC3763288.1 hypothetical protein [Glycomyces sp. TRM65418]QZD57983.1 hypothetical protein K3N28_09355 [Glycomyces sp. TRM65418]
MHDFDLRIMLQLCGAFLYITNYLLVQTHRIQATKPASLGLVVSACAILLSAAVIGHDYGLILLEGTWLVLVSTTIVIRRRAAARKAVLEREALLSAVERVRVEPAAESDVAPAPAEPVVARERELAGAAA